VVLYDVASQKRIGDTPIALIPSRVVTVALSADAKLLATGCAGRVALWDLSTRDRLSDAPCEITEGDAPDIALSADGSILAAGSNQGVMLWDLSTRTRLVEAPLKVSEGPFGPIALSADGRTLAIGFNRADHSNGLSGGVVLWNVTTGRRLIDAPMVVSEGAVTSVALDAQGKILVAGYFDRIGDAGVGGGVVVWDVIAGERLVDAPLALGGAPVRAVALSADGTSVAAVHSRNTGSTGGAFVLSNIGLDYWRTLAGQTVNRNFTRAEWRQFFHEEAYDRTFPGLPWPPDLQESERPTAGQSEK